MTYVAELPDRGAIAIEGEDRVAFLQGLVSNDVEQAAPGRAVWAAFLTPQGKWLADFFIFADGDRLLLDTERAQIAALVPRLSRYRLRAKVSVKADETMRIYAAWGGDGLPTSSWPDSIRPPDAAQNSNNVPLGVPGTSPGMTGLGGLRPIAAPDPRLSEAGWRLIAAAPIPTNATPAAYDSHRLALGLPDGSRDMEADKSILLEAGFDELSGVSWTKGCYMGQELTARTKYRGLVKRRLVPVVVEGPAPAPGTPILRGGIDLGTMRSARDGVGMAVLRLDALKPGATLTCGEATLTPRVPPWMALPT